MKAREQELYRRVDEILHYIWDPIGVSDIPGARNEYHSYLPKVYKLLVNGAKDHEIAQYLVSVVNGSMGMSADKQKALETAQLLVDTMEELFD